jgi:hypothetical protein
MPTADCSLGQPMMKKSRRTTKFTIETERTFIFRNFGGQQPGWCVGCGAEAQMATVADAARAVGLSELALYQLLDPRRLHFTENADRRVLVCLNSLFEIDTKGERS